MPRRGVERGWCRSSTPWCAGLTRRLGLAAGRGRSRRVIVCRGRAVRLARRIGGWLAKSGKKSGRPLTP